MTAEDQKKLDDLKADLNSQKANYEIYAKGSQFIAVEPYSAKGLYGAKWKNVIIEKFGEEYFDGNANFSGNKPIDFKIACINTANAGHFNKGSNVIISASQGASCDGKYNGQHKVIDQGNNYIVILFPFVGDASGLLVSQSKLAGLEKAIEKTEKKIGILTGLSKGEPANKPINKNNRHRRNLPAIIRKNKGLFFILIILLIIYLANKPKITGT